MDDKKELLRRKYDELVNEDPDVKHWIVDVIGKSKSTFKQYKRSINIFSVISIIVMFIIFYRVSQNTSTLINFFEGISFEAIAIGSFIFFMVIIIIALRVIKKNDNTRKKYREKVEIPLIKIGCNPEEINDKRGIQSAIYRRGGFREGYDSYTTKGYMRFKRENIEIELAKVITMYEATENRQTIYTFEGLVAVARLNENITKGYIKIFSDKDDKRRKEYKGPNEKIHMDSVEFEQQFDVYSDDPITALKILTTSVMQELIEIKQKYNWDYDITITGNIIILRVRIKNASYLLSFRVGQFENLPKGQDIKESLIYDIDLVSNMIDFTETISKYINNE